MKTEAGWDTIRLAWKQQTDDNIIWDDIITQEVGGTRRAYANHELIQITRVSNPKLDIDEFQVQTSIPKLLRSSNLVPAAGHDLRVALPRLNSLIHEYLPSAMDAEEMLLRRLDATENRYLESEENVVKVFKALRDTEIRCKRPRSGDTLTSLKWTGRSGGFAKTAYGKFEESRDVAATGVFRLEVGAIGQRAMMKVVDEAARPRRYVDLRTAIDYLPITDNILSRLRPQADDALLVLAPSQPYMTVVDRLKQDGCTSNQIAQLLGYALQIKAAGWDSLDVSRAGRYRLQKQFSELNLDPRTVDLLSA